MVQTTVFKNNRSQAVRLPKEVALPDDIKSVDVIAVGNKRIISPAGTAWDDWFEGSGVSDDFMGERGQSEVQLREAF
ncbi:MAG: antitoxin [Gammaproteobacteria bacterium]|jgi:antitoxin VapB|uniref:type II toxin-antitoxin system VapB family antitoxin n=1 Tax=Methylotuvimicrobium sp. TaxID=2822413 RepID=UPI001E0C2A09|nr:antitoxin [Gammaproteobacteria bacterium]